MSDLALLLRQLDRAESPRARLEMVARAWKVVRHLPPHERAQLAQATGIDGAEAIVEGLAARDGRLRPGVLMRALELARDKDPAELAQVLGSLRSRKGRRELVKKGAAAMADYLRGPVVPTPPVVEPPKKTAAPVVKAAAVTGGAAAIVAAARATSTKSEPKPEPQPVPKEEPRPEPKAVVTPRPKVAAPAPPKPVAPPPRRVAPAPAPTPRVDPSELLERLASAPNPSQRLRRLRADLGRLKHAPAGTLSDVLERFGHDWSRRRALAAMLEAGLPGDVDQALELIRAQASAATRRWCRSTLLHREGLPEAARERVQAYDPTVI